MAARGDLPAALDRARELAAGPLGSVTAAVSRWSDPREKLLRQRRAARAASTVLGGGTGVLGVTTVALAASPVTDWVVAGGGGLTALVAVPTVAALARWRSLRRTPLPAPRPAPVRRPGRGSSAHPPLRRLDRAETSLRELLGLLDRDPGVPSTEVGEARVAAVAAASALRHEAAGLAALERAAGTSDTAAAELGAVLASARERLEDGVADYDGLVAAAARAVAVGSGPDGHTEPLTAAVDRVDALTAALTELAGLHTTAR